MLVKELKGPPLDYWVAKVLGHRAIISPVDGLCKIGCRLDLVPCQSDLGQVFQPSSNWNQGGPLIDRYKILFNAISKNDGSFDCYEATIRFPSGRVRAIGMTHLVAAMRAIVYLEYGDEVPDNE